MGIANEDPSTGAENTLAEHWDGTSWVIQPTLPPGGSSAFTAVSCSSPSSCTAVGFVDGQAEDGPLPLAQHWNGTQWAGQRGPSDATTFLSGVSCTSRKACIAVGTDPAVGPMAWRWNGTRWIRQTIGGTESLNGVSCSARRRCTAVGYDLTTSGNSLTLAERWNGRRWSIKPTRSPSPA